MFYCWCVNSYSFSVCLFVCPSVCLCTACASFITIMIIIIVSDGALNSANRKKNCQIRSKSSTTFFRFEVAGLYSPSCIWTFLSDLVGEAVVVWSGCTADVDGTRRFARVRNKDSQVSVDCTPHAPRSTDNADNERIKPIWNLQLLTSLATNRVG